MPRPGALGIDAGDVDVVDPAGLGGPSEHLAQRADATARTAGSVVIPAHNEAAVIARSLDRLIDSLSADVEVVVACNGCTDVTPQIARRWGRRLTVIELDVASKPAALRAADRLAHAFPRVYLDADVVVSGTAVHAVLEHLGRPGALAARPPLAYDTSSSSWIVRRFYRARAAVPAVMGSLWGAGIYALSAEGRRRFDEFPSLVADDLFVDRLFRPGEINLVDTEPVIVVAPTTTAGLLASFRRVFRGNRAVTEAPAGGRPGTRATVQDLLRLARRGPAELVDATVYAAVVLAARALAWRVPRTPGQWERDETSRR
jgi:Glycosyl transferase family 2